MTLKQAREIAEALEDGRANEFTYPEIRAAFDTLSGSKGNTAKADHEQAEQIKANIVAHRKYSRQPA